MGARTTRWAATVAALVAVLTPVSAWSATMPNAMPNSMPNSTPIGWRTDLCGPDVRRAGAELRTRWPGSGVECARIVVPMDWNRPAGKTITVQVTRVPRLLERGDDRPTRVLLVNPGGPGVTADWLAPNLASAAPDIHRTHDIVAVDPRGSGNSTPLACAMVDDGVTDYRAPSAAEIARQQQAARREVAACAARDAAYLRTIGTASTVRDLDLVRSRLGAQTVDFYGVSAGTWLAAHYAQTFPRRVGRFVLDGNTEFTADWRRSFGWQPLGFERRYRQQFLPWLARRNQVYRLGATAAAVGATYERIRAQVAAGRLPGVVPNDLDLVMIQGLYFDSTFPDLADLMVALTRAVGEHPAAGAAASARAGGTAAAALARFRRAVLGSPAADHVSAEDTVFMAVQCNDDAWVRDPASYLREGMALGRRYPLLGYTWVTSACAYWPFPDRPLPRATGEGVPPLLMVQAELDPATPWEGASLAHRAHASARLLAVDDSGNHGSLMTGNTCVESAVTAWLVDGVLPPPGTTCAGLPLPGEASVPAYQLRPSAPARLADAVPGRGAPPQVSFGAGASQVPGAGELAGADRVPGQATGANAVDAYRTRFQQRLLAGQVN
ncbi:MAG: alpha/beta fold hydrolase [Austwickia sp.]|nr:alpha/beta fold hydrolase [Austwickia sp.]